MKSILFFSILTSFTLGVFAQTTIKSDSTKTFKKRVLDYVELDMLTSFYTQDGNNASVTGGIGTEQLEDYATNINISIPLNDDDVLSIDGTVSAYTSASSSNLDPFSGASVGGETRGTPWLAASGASKSDIWTNVNLGYSHSSNDRNNVYNYNLSFSTEYDYTSVGAGLGLAHLFNEKNTEVNFGANVFLDQWKPEYPTELDTYIEANGNLNDEHFSGVDIFDQTGTAIDKTNTATAWRPHKNTLIENKGRNTFSFSLGLSQILSKNTQMSLFSDITYQSGWLANPLQRVYFSDVDNFYIGNASSIPNYESASNHDVFQLADDIERLPNNRLKIPVGLRVNHYINEFLILKTYYRYYFDDWGLTSNTFNVELPIKIGSYITLYPNFRHYTQSQADYFAPFEQHVSTSEFYTSDYDLSKFNANQYGIGLKYTDVFTKKHIWKFGLKNISLNYNYYERNTGLKAHIVSLGAKFVLDRKIKWPAFMTK